MRILPTETPGRRERTQPNKESPARTIETAQIFVESTNEPVKEEQGVETVVGEVARGRSAMVSSARIVMRRLA